MAVLITSKAFLDVSHVGHVLDDGSSYGIGFHIL